MHRPCRHGLGGDSTIALVEGYRQHRPLPASLLAHLDSFIAARRRWVWLAGTAQVNPDFRDSLDGELAAIAESPTILLGS